MKRFTRIAAVGVAALGLLMGASPAHADQLGVVAFTGTATLNPGLNYPIPPACIGRNGTWTLTGTGVGVSVNSVQAVGTVGLNVANGMLHAGGVQNVVAQSTPLTCLGSGGFCGASGGSLGAGTITLNPLATVPPGGGPHTVNVSDVNWIQSAASLIVFQGDTQAGHNYLAGVVSAIPPLPVPPGGPSCVNGTATSFTIVGVGIAIY